MSSGKIIHPPDKYTHQFGEETVAALIDGDLTAMENIYNTLFSQIYSYSLSYVADTEQAKEIAQDSFVSLWEARKKLKRDSNIKGYLLRVTRNKSLNWLSRQRSQRNYLDYISYRERMVNYDALRDKSAELLLTNELQEIIGQTMKQLPENQLEVFLLNRDGELTYGQIADKLGISVKTVEYRMMCVLRVFREVLKPFLYSSLFLLIFS